MPRSKKDPSVYRLVEFVLLPALLITAFIVTACSVSIGWGSSRSYSSGGYTSLTINSGNESFLARTMGSRTLHVAVYRRGRIYGVDGLSDAQRKQIRGFQTGRDLVDHPKLQEWQDQLDRMSKMAGDPDTQARQLADAGEGFPFDKAVDGLWMEYLNEDPDRARATLDVVEDLDLRSSSLRKVVQLAIRGDTVRDERLADWISTKTILDDRKAFEALATSRHLGPKSARHVIQKIDDLSSSSRARAFEGAGSKLVAKPQNARLIVSNLDELYGNDRARVALNLLGKNADPAFAVELLRNIDEFYGGDRRRVFMAAARSAVQTDEGGELLVDNIDELYGSDRSQAAIRIIGWKDTPQPVVLGFLREIDEFYGSHQEKVLEAVIDSPHFADPKVQRAALRGAKDELTSSRLRRILQRMSKSNVLDDSVRKLIDRARKDQ